MTADIDAWLRDPDAHDRHYALPTCSECGEEIEEGIKCPDCKGEDDD